MKIFLILLLGMLVVSACSIGPNDDWEDGGSPDDCHAACDNLAKLGCPGAEGSPGPDEEYGTQDDVSCAEVCQNVMEEGGISMHPACVASADNCSEADECFD